jgi:hypothetical protein
MRVAVADCCLLLKLKSSPIMVAVKRRHLLQQACRVALATLPTKINHHRRRSTPGISIHSSHCCGESTPGIPALSRTLAVSVSPLTSIQLHSTLSMQLSIGCEAVFAKVDWFPPSILPKTKQNNGTQWPVTESKHTLGAVAFKAIMVARRLTQFKSKWQCQFFPHQSFMGLGRFIAMESFPSS